MTHVHLLYAMVLIASLVAAVTDVRRGLIPNWLTLPLLLVAPLLHALRAGWAGVVLSVLGLLICGSIPLLFHRLGAMGGGDVKLFAALGALVGPGMGLEIELLSLSIAFGYGLCVMAWNGRLLASLRQSGVLVGNMFLPSSRRRDVPAESLTTLRIGAAIFAGSCLAVLDHTLLGGMLS
jgi:prepilin peptidase CpaA